MEEIARNYISKKSYLSMKHFYLVLLLLSLLSLAHCQAIGTVPCDDPNCDTCESTNTNCTACFSGYYLDDKFGNCSTCSSRFSSCTKCNYNYRKVLACEQCESPLFPDNYNTDTACRNCSDIVKNCEDCYPRIVQTVQLACNICADGFFRSEDSFSCKANSQTADTIKYVAFVTVGLGLLAGLFTIFKCSRKGSGGRQRLVEEDQN